VDAAQGTGSGELSEGSVNRGFAAFNNGYAAAVGAENHGGPKVFLLSQARLADASTAEEEVTALATFLGVSVPAGMTFPLSPTFGDTSVLTSEQVTLIDTTFATPAVDPRVTERYTAGPLSSSALPPTPTPDPPGATEIDLSLGSTTETTAVDCPDGCVPATAGRDTPTTDGGRGVRRLRHLLFSSVPLCPAGCSPA